jgi:hypothetical protein
MADFNFLGLTNRVLGMAGQTVITSLSTDPAEDAYRVQLCVNDTIQDLSNVLRIKSRMSNYSFNTVVGQRTYALPKNIEYPVYDLVRQTDNMKLNFVETNIFDLMQPKPADATDNPSIYYLEGFFGVQIQPASTGEIVSMASSSASDINIDVVIQGYDASGNYVEEVIVLIGTSTVTSTNTFSKINSISKGNTTGSISFTGSVSGTAFLTLNSYENSALFAHIGLHPVPNLIVNIVVRGFAKIPSLNSAYSVPVGLTERHINAIIAGTYARYMKYEPKYISDGANTLWGIYKDEIAKIVAADARILDYQPRMKQAGELTRLYTFRPLDRESN